MHSITEYAESEYQPSSPEYEEETTKNKRTEEPKETNQILSVDYSCDGRLFATAGSDMVVCIIYFIHEINNNIIIIITIIIFGIAIIIIYFLFFRFVCMMSIQNQISSN